MRTRIWIMPEKRDEDFTYELLKRFNELASSLKVSAYTIEIEEKYSSEEKAHYHMKIEHGLCIDLPQEIGVTATYSATANGETYEGQMKLKLRANGPQAVNTILAAILFAYYDECIRIYYREWETDYKEFDFPSNN